jgi:gamma-resorcylate decarboxylase
MNGKIALEEHLSTPANDSAWDDQGEATRNGIDYTNDIKRRLHDTELRLKDMDVCGIRHTILSLTSPGTQAQADGARAADFAKATNDYIAEKFVAVAPRRFSAFATVSLHDPKAAADELERAVKSLGAKGALINGYTNTADGEMRYLDEAPVWEFWDRVAQLNVPVYLHPREPRPGDGLRIYRGYESLVGSAWGFAFETSTHAVRLMMSGLFDKYPNLTVILGHLGEGLSFLLPRCEHRLYKQRHGSGLGKNRKPLTEYLRSNFYVTTSGHFHTNALNNALAELGEDRVMFSVDYPYEDMHEGSPWFDKLQLAKPLMEKIAFGNAQRLFKLPQ